MPLTLLFSDWRLEPLKKSFGKFAGLMSALLMAGAVHAADYPVKDKPVTLVVPFVAGGPTDRVARDLAEALRKPLGAPKGLRKATASVPSSLNPAARWSAMLACA